MRFSADFVHAYCCSHQMLHCGILQHAYTNCSPRDLLFHSCKHFCNICCTSFQYR